MNIVKNFEKINLPSLFTKNNLIQNTFVVITIIFLLDKKNEVQKIK